MALAVHRGLQLWRPRRLWASCPAVPQRVRPRVRRLPAIIQRAVPLRGGDGERRQAPTSPATLVQGGLSSLSRHLTWVVSRPCSERCRVCALRGRGVCVRALPLHPSEKSPSPLEIGVLGAKLVPKLDRRLLRGPLCSLVDLVLGKGGFIIVANLPGAAVAFSGPA